MDFNFDIAQKNRLLFKKHLEELTLGELGTIPTGFNNNIFWNIAHVVATQQILTYIFSGLPAKMPQALIAKYKKGTRPEGVLDQKDVDEVKALLFSTLDHTEEDHKAGNFKNFEVHTMPTGVVLKNIGDAMHFNDFHEGIHLGSILALRRSIVI